MSLSYTSILAGASGQSSGYTIPYSCRFVSGNSAYLTRTPSSITSKRILSLDFWVKRATLSTAQAIISKGGAAGSIGLEVQFTAADKINITCEDGVGGNTILRTTTQVFRDVSAWYNIHIDFNSNLTTTSSCLLYVNGSQVTSFTSTTNPGAAVDLGLNTTDAFNIGRRFNASNYFDGYLAQFIYADGTQFATTVAGTTNTSGVWVPKALTGITYGAAGFLMAFANSAALGTDTSGNGNTFTSSGLTSADQMSDTPTNVFAVLNPIHKSSSVTLSNGNLTYTTTLQRGAYGTIGVSSGKWYWEWKPGATGSETYVGIGTPNSPTDVALDSGTPSGVIVYGGFNGNLYTTGAGAAYGATFTTGDTIGVALDMDAGTLTFYKNNTTQGTAASSLTGTKVPVVSASNTHSGTINFGQTAFTYTPPTGFSALNTSNLPAPSIKDGSAHFQTALHTGTGSALTINQSGNSTFTSDFVWTKGRSGATDHILSNSISGTGKYLKSNSDAAEVTDAQALTAFGAGSISYGTLAAANTNAATYVDWMWKGGGAGVSNTSGSITSTVSANTTAGISIVTYTGTGANATVGHGLGVAPKMIIIKRRNAVEDWFVYHGGMTSPSGKYLVLDSTAASTSSATIWNSTDPTSTVFSLGTASGANANAGTFVAYCWAGVASFSSIGSYTGNGSADGPFIYTGFKPAWILLKNSVTAARDWVMYDTARQTYNVMGDATNTPNLVANAASSEATVGGWLLDATSNGFKIRETSSTVNGTTIIYAAFASNPFGGSGAAPATAR